MNHERRIEELKKEIIELEKVAKACAKLLMFKGINDSKNQKLYKSITEITHDENYNKAAKLPKLCNEAIGASIGTKEQMDAIKMNFSNTNEQEEIYRKYFSKSKSLEDIKGLLISCVEKIMRNQNLIKAHKSEMSNKPVETKELIREVKVTPIPTETNYNIDNKIDIKQLKSPKSIQERLTYRSMLTDNEIKAIKKLYNLEEVKYSSIRFVSDKSITQLIEIYDVNEGLKNNYDMHASIAAEAFNHLYELTLKELKEGALMNDNGVRKNMRNFAYEYGGGIASEYGGGIDFVERYNKMYTNMQKYINSIPKDKRDAFMREFSDNLDKTIKLETGSFLITPEAFRRQVNDEIEEELTRDANNFNPINSTNLSHFTKYMSADEIARLYYRVKNKDYYGVEEYPEVKETCIGLILNRMSTVDINDPQRKEIIDKRTDSIKRDYFNENINVEDDYAKKLVSQKELIVDKKKEYFRMNKFKRTLATINYKKLLELANKYELNNKEENEIRRMF